MVSLNIGTYYIFLFKSYSHSYFTLLAAFKIIKTWLPAKAVKKIKFLSKHNLSEFVPKESTMVSWGGEDTYEFSFEPETKRNEEIKKKV